MALPENQSLARRCIVRTFCYFIIELAVLTLLIVGLAISLFALGRRDSERLAKR